MAPDKEHRIRNAIGSLISELIPSDIQDNRTSVRHRHEARLESIKRILESQAAPSISSDINHASDLIRKKLVQSKPHQALRYSNLYNRLLSQSVLGQKWAILYFLYQLVDHADPSEPLPLTPARSLYKSRDPLPQQDDGDNVQGSMSMSRSGQIEGENSDSSFRPEMPQTFLPNGIPRSRREKEVGGANRKGRDPQSSFFSEKANTTTPSEATLLRDLPFTLQGLGSTTLAFSATDSLRLPSTLPAPVVALFYSLAEPSLLYRRLEAFTKAAEVADRILPKKTLTQKSPGTGLLSQSLRAAIAAELRSYLTLVATLEGQIRRALPSFDDPGTRNIVKAAGVTLKRCVVWTKEATMGLRLLSLIAEESNKGRRGGQLISLIHGFSSSHGDPIVAAFAERLLAEVTRPFYDILRHWIYDGELLDPYQEFFVKEHESHSDSNREAGTSNVWVDKYEIDNDMIPSIITEDFAQKVFLIGKSLNFIRHSCGDSHWVEDYSKVASKELRYGDTATLEASIDEAYKITMKRLVDLMANKFRLFEHLKALKDYILLGQGDFIALLMESLSANLDRPAEAQYRHTLTAQLEHAIRGSNAQYDPPEVLRRLDARMLQLSHGDIGWDCFTLEYKVDAPVDVVVTDWGNRQYLKVFNFLWRVKRVEFALSSTWRKCMTGSRGVLQNPSSVVVQTWKSTRGLLAEMIHFVGQLQYYILFEVIESSWGELQRRIRKDGCTLDDIIKAHTRYLNDITHKGLLGAKRRSHQGADSAATEDNRTWHLTQLSELLRIMLNYRDSVDGLYSWSVSDFTLRQEADVRHLSSKEGSDRTMAAPTSPVGLEFPALQDRLKQLGSSFRTRVQILLGDLAYQPDVDMRFLGVTMNFNDVYQPARRKSKPSNAPGSATAGVARE